MFGNAIAQETGLISGTVSSAVDGMTLPGAVLKLDKFNRYTVSGYNGYYEFLNVPAGEYTVEVEYLGFQTTTLPATVTPQGNTVLNFSLAEGSQEIDAVVVMGDMMRGQAKALNQQKTNANITNMISADQVAASPIPTSATPSNVCRVSRCRTTKARRATSSCAVWPPS